MKTSYTITDENGDTISVRPVGGQIVRIDAEMGADGVLLMLDRERTENLIEALTASLAHVGP